MVNYCTNFCKYLCKICKRFQKDDKDDKDDAITLEFWKNKICILNEYDTYNSNLAIELWDKKEKYGENYIMDEHIMNDDVMEFDINYMNQKYHYPNLKNGKEFFVNVCVQGLDKAIEYANLAGENIKQPLPLNCGII